MDTPEPKPEMTLAQMVNAWEPINTFFQKFADLGPLLRGIAALDQVTGESERRMHEAIDAADHAERVTADKLELFQQKITRATEESGRILAKATADADTTRANAEREAEVLLSAARTDAETARDGERAAIARSKELELGIAAAETQLRTLTEIITVAQAKIAEFTK